MPVTQNSRFKLPHATTQDINKNINSLISDKATGSEGIPVRFIELPANVIDNHLPNIINKDIDPNFYSESAKNVRTIFKEDEKIKVKHYRHVSLLNIFSKICERFIHENLTPSVNSFLSDFVSA